jgi:hypothetical protein
MPVYEYESSTDIWGISFNNLHTRLDEKNGTYQEPNIFKPRVTVKFEKGRNLEDQRSTLIPMPEEYLVASVLNSHFATGLARNIILPQTISVLTNLEEIGFTKPTATLLTSEVKPFYEQLLEQRTSELGTKQTEVKRIKARLKT